MKTESENGANTPLSNPLKADFYDSSEWERLCERTRYVLPNWSVYATRENIRLWLCRLDIKEAVYREAMQTNIDDMLALNPTWPLRAFVGLLLEYKFTS
jgi:hypothetical protein